MKRTSFTPPRELRELRAAMALAHISMQDVSRAAKVPYDAVSAILSGIRVSPKQLARIRNVITSAPVPA